jgi:ATP-binding cassette subfamily C protein LapB
MRAISERTLHLAAFAQQCAYVLLVAVGAIMITSGQLSMGALIACSILSGRILAPLAAIPSQLIQWAHARAALDGLERLWALQDDHHGQQHAIEGNAIRGHFRLEYIVASYGASLPALEIPTLTIRNGEKIGVLGPVGAGKTTLLRILSGMYKPQQGRVLLDDVDLCYLAKPQLAERMAYLPQDGRLFAGTLRDNLLLGLKDPGDEAILAAARKTGLLQSVIARHPKGLFQEIHEGGTGLSGGQRQLVNLTRTFLRQPSIWLLDEPSAAMDRQLEVQVTAAIRQEIGPDDTLVLVTHKHEMLDLVDRLIVIAEHQVVLDGPKELILQRLRNNQPVRGEAA